jgi:hypothetical protein
MQRLAEIDTRRRQLMAEMDSLNAEELELKRALAQASTMDPSLMELVRQSTTQHGCAEAQTRLENASEGERSAIFVAAVAELRQLLTQTYGALFVLKLLETAGLQELEHFLRALTVGSTLVDVASSASGARVIQRYMELLQVNSPVAVQFMHVIASRLVPLANDMHGSHIVQRALTNRFTGEKDLLIDALVKNCVAVATNKQGCCVLQRAIDWLPEQGRDRVISAVIHNELELVQDAFGNYVVQHLLDRKDEAIAKRTIQPLLHNIAGLACNKFGSNVIEKCVRIAHPNVKQLLIDELTDPSVLPRLLQDSFANYVIQTAISCCSEEQFQQLHAAIRPSFASLKNSPYGVRIEAKIQRRLKDNARARQRQTKKKMQEVTNTSPPTFSHNMGGGPVQISAGGQRGYMNNNNSGLAHSHHLDGVAVQFSPTTSLAMAPFQGSPVATR